MRISEYSFEEFLEKVRDFHGSAAPGIIIGGLMIDLARRNLPPGELFDVIVESAACLPDAVQLLTPCTTGNGWLHVIDQGKFALTFFEKEEGRGARVYVDPEKLEKWGEVKAWFYKEKPKKEQDFDLLMSQMKEAGDELFSLEKVTVDIKRFEKIKKGKTVNCPSCGEAYPLNHGEVCKRCAGDAPYL